MPYNNQPSNQSSNPRVQTNVGATQEERPNAESTSSTLTDALLGTDPPIEQEHPGLQPALVFASYPLMLIVVISIVAMYFVFFRSNPNQSNAPPVQTESSK
jgi:hypothetical protein